MLFLSALLISLVYQATSVAVWQQCGGKEYTGSKQCDAGNACIVVNEWYYQCQPSANAPTVATSTQTVTTTTTKVAATTTTKAGSTTTTKAASTTAGSSTSSGKLNGCNFGYGRAFDQASTDYSKFDYITIWIGTIDDKHSTDFNQWYQGEMINTCLKQNKLPVFYSYIVAFEARNKQGLKDCDVGSPNLCEQGANFIRNNRDYLVGRYKYQAQNIAKYLGKDKKAVFEIEPDFYQYYSDAKQANGPLSGEYMRALFDDFVKAIKSELPNAIISFDISAWATQEQMRKWWSYFASSTDIDYLHTSGGQSRPDIAGIKPNELTWSFMSQLTGKKIIADCGYGVAGAADNNCMGWKSDSNLSNRVKDGVVAVSQGSYNFDPSLRPNVC